MNDPSIKSLFANAESLRNTLSQSYETNTENYRSTVAIAIATYEECRVLADRLSLFSPNEILEDITTGDLQYLLIDYHLGHLYGLTSSPSRVIAITSSRTAYSRFLSLLNNYSLLTTPPSVKTLYDAYLDSPTTFSTILTKDPSAKRTQKIVNFQRERELKKNLDYLRENPAYLEKDEDAVRDVMLSNIELSVHDTFQALESLVREEEVLKLAPKEGEVRDPEALARDYRLRMGISDSSNEYSERLDGPQTMNRGSGPLLSKDGKPLRPFTILDRQNLQAGVFRSGHRLPTMSIDEFLEEEKKRGGIIEGGGEASGIKELVDEDDYSLADKETYKAREWDEFVEANPKGSGNTLNRG